jgi:hypothetical protein
MTILLSLQPVYQALIYLFVLILLLVGAILLWGAFCNRS